MSTSFVFWLLMLLWLIFGLVFYWPFGVMSVGFLGSNFFMFVLMCLLGWKVFGSPLKN